MKIRMGPYWLWRDENPFKTAIGTGIEKCETRESWIKDAVERYLESRKGYGYLLYPIDI